MPGERGPGGVGAQAPELREQLVDAWQANNRINLFLIDRISDEGMACTLSTRGGRDVCRQFAHMHNVRGWSLEKRARELFQGLELFATADRPSKSELKQALTASGAAIETFLCDVLAGKPKRRGFKHGIFSTLSYFVAHESHHRGSILLTLKQCGHALDRPTSYGIWGMWDRQTIPEEGT